MAARRPSCIARRASLQIRAGGGGVSTATTTLRSAVTRAVTDRGSAFAACAAWPVRSVREAERATVALRREYASAPGIDHAMSAYRVPDGLTKAGKQRFKAAFDDDGEPRGGAAARAELNALRACGVAVVVTRVWGGENLGKVRAQRAGAGVPGVRRVGGWDGMGLDGCHKGGNAFCLLTCMPRLTAAALRAHPRAYACAAAGAWLRTRQRHGWRQRQQRVLGCRWDRACARRQWGPRAALGGAYGGRSDADSRDRGGRSGVCLSGVRRSSGGSAGADASRGRRRGGDVECVCAMSADMCAPERGSDASASAWLRRRPQRSAARPPHARRSRGSSGVIRG